MAALGLRGGREDAGTLVELKEDCRQLLWYMRGEKPPYATSKKWKDSVVIPAFSLAKVEFVFQDSLEVRFDRWPNQTLILSEKLLQLNSF